MITTGATLNMSQGQIDGRTRVSDETRIAASGGTNVSDDPSEHSRVLNCDGSQLDSLNQLQHCYHLQQVLTGNKPNQHCSVHARASASPALKNLSQRLRYPGNVNKTVLLCY